MSNPRYVPRDFAVTPRDFGQVKELAWVALSDDADTLAKARRSAAKTQHQISYGVRNIYMPHSGQPKITLLAEALEVPYDRLHKVLTGRAVMQLEDIGRLRGLVGAELDFWFLRDETLTFVEASLANLAREQERARMRPRTRPDAI